MKLSRLVKFGVLALIFPVGSVYADSITRAMVQDGLYGGPATYSYNYSNPGFADSGGCPGPTFLPSLETCALTVSAITDTVGDIFSSFDTVELISHIAASPPEGFPDATATADASATANLTTASISVSAGGNYLDYRFPNMGRNGGSGDAFAEVNDILHFTVAGASSATVTDFSVTFTVTQAEITGLTVADSFGSIQTTLQLGGASISDAFSDFAGLVNENKSGGGWVSFSDHGGVLTGIYSITGPSAALEIAANQEANCGLGSSCIAGGVVTFGLPKGMSFISDSGVFPGSPAAPAVPEPGAWTLAACGLAVMPFAARKLRARE